MPDFPAPAPPDTDPAADDLLRAVLDVSLSPLNLLRPRYAARSGIVVDFAFDYLNPAAQRLTGLPGQPGGTLQTHFPDAFANGLLDFYRRVFETGAPGEFELHYQAGQHGTFLQVAARRHAGQLVVSFLDMAQGPRTAVETALRESRAHEQAARAGAERQRGELQRVFEQAPLAIAVFRGPNYIIELANPTVCRLWGRRQRDILGKGLFEAVPEAAGMGYEQLLDEVMATGVPYVAHGMEAQHDRNGRRETAYWDFVYVPMYEPDGRVYGAMVVATEATAQVLAGRQMQQLNEELELRVTARSAEARAAQFEAEQQREHARAQQALLSQILRQTPAAIATLSGPEHRFSFFNDEYLALTAGRARLGRPAVEVLPEVEEQGFIALLDQVYATGEPFVGTETTLMLQDAAGRPELRYVDFIYQPLFDGQARPQGILAFVLDVTDKVRVRKQADTLQAAMLGVLKRQAQAREAQQAELRHVFEQAPVAIAILRGPALVVELANAAVAAIWGRPTAQVLGRPYFEALPETAGQGFEQILADVLRTGQPFRVQETPVLLPQPGRAQPRQAYVDFVFQPLLDDQQRATSLLAMGIEVTDQVLARRRVLELNQELAAINEELQVTNEELLDTNNRLTRTNADLDTFVYTASHDLKAPIANIEGLLEALRYDLPPAVLAGDGVTRLLDMMEGSVARFQQTIGHLTSISQVQHRESAETVDLPVLIQGVQLDLGPLIEAAGATLTVQADGCAAVRVAPKTLRSVVYNLLSNAIKYRAPGRPAQVQLRAHCAPEHLILEVQDNGLGLTDDQQGRLFGMFRRLHTHVEGSGVGLFMVKRLVENAGGTITVQSQPGVGTTFRVTLPT